MVAPLMSDRPPLHPIALEQLERAAKKIDADYWHVLKALQVDYRGPKTLSPPKTPQLLLNHLQMYAGGLFRLEELNYPKDSSSYGLWLAALAERIIARVIQTVNEVEASPEDARLAYHGLGMNEMRTGLRSFLSVVISEYSGAPMSSTTGPGIIRASLERRRRPSGIESLSAARKVDAYLKSHGIGYTDFAATVGITDKTLRGFLRTGKTRRHIFANIAAKMGTTAVDLLST